MEKLTYNKMVQIHANLRNGNCNSCENRSREECLVENIAFQTEDKPEYSLQDFRSEMWKYYKANWEKLHADCAYM